MKRLVTLVAACAAMPLMAETEKVGDYTWTYSDIDGGEVEVQGVSPATGDVTIPATLGGKPVTSIGYGAFHACSGLTSVAMPDSVTYVAPYAFEYCSGLLNVAMGDGVTTIDSYAFNGCSSLTSIMMPSSVKTIADHAFLDCSLLNSVTIGNGVETIGDSAFEGCSSLFEALLPASFKTAANIDKIFQGCPMYIYDEVEYRDVNVKVVGGVAWAYVVRGGKAAVGGGAGDRAIAPSTVGGIAIPSKLGGYPVTAVGRFAFFVCEGITSVSMPSGVTNIEVGAFSGCIGLASVKMPDGVTSIGRHAFESCEALKSVTIPGGVTTIGEEAFIGCMVLSDVYCHADPAVLKWGDASSDFKGKQTKIHVLAAKLSAYKAKFGSNVRATFVGDLAPCTFTLTFNANGGKASETKRKVEEYSAAGTLPKATKKGYTLKGWYTKKSGGSKLAASTKINKNATYYAQWTANKYKIKFNKNGGKGTMKALSATYDKNVTLRANAFKRTGYKFKGWAKTKKGKVAYKNKAKVKNLTDKNGKTVTLYAVWKKA